MRTSRLILLFLIGVFGSLDLAKAGTLRPPANLKIGLLGLGTIRLEWDDVEPNASGYIVEFATSPSGPFMYGGKTYRSDHTYNDRQVIDALDANTQYYFRVASYRGSNVKTESDELSSYVTITAKTRVSRETFVPPGLNQNIRCFGRRSALFAINLYEDNNGSVGRLITNDRIEAGKSFFAEVSGQAGSSPYRAIKGFQIDIDWNPDNFESLDNPFDPDALITPDYGFQSGELDNTKGLIHGLGGMAFTADGSGRPIGRWREENLALLHFKAKAATYPNQAWMHSRIRYAMMVPSVTLDKLEVCSEAQTITIVNCRMQGGVKTCDGDDVVPESPTELEAYAIFGQDLRLKWKESAVNEDTIRVERAEGMNGSFKEIANLTANSVDLKAKRPTLEKTYRYRVVAKNRAGASQYSNIVVLEGTEPEETLLGDLNSDGKVDMLDVGILKRSFGANRQSSDYTEEADPNHDGIIDLKDLGILKSEFGSSL